MQASLGTPESIQNQCTIVQQVFETMANMHAVPLEQDTSTVHDAITSSLTFSEPSSGRILVECSPDLAFTFTSRLMSIKRPGFVDEDVEDAMRELANMIGGNLKGLMPEETCVSIPHMVGKQERDGLHAAGRILSRISFRLDAEHSCAITLFHDEPN